MENTKKHKTKCPEIKTGGKKCDVADLVLVAEDGFHDGDEVGLGREVVHPEHPLELLQDDDGGRAAHEPGDGGVRQEIHYQP